MGMENVFRIGTLVTADNGLNYAEGRITSICKSTGTKKGMIYKVGNNYFFGDEIKPVGFNNTPNGYYDIITELKEDLFSAIRQYGHTFKNGSMSYSFKKSSRPFINFGSMKIRIKQIIISPCCEITIVTEDGEKFGATYDYNVYMYCYWAIYADVENKAKK